MEEKNKTVPRLQLRRPSAVVIPRWKWLALRILVAVAGGLVLILTMTLAIVATTNTTPPYCSSGLGIKDKNLNNPGLFNDLTPKEMTAVRNYLHSQKRLNLIPFENATVDSSYIFMMSLQVPLKAAVLNFQGGMDRKPQRAAKVIVFRGDVDPPRVEEYVVGPLPTPKFYRVVTSPAYRRVPVPFSSRPIDGVEKKQLMSFLSSATEELHSFFQENYNLTFHNCTFTDTCIMFKDFGPAGTKSGERKSWFWAYKETSGFYYHPLGFAIQLDHLSVNALDWSVSAVNYNGHIYNGVNSLIEAYANGTAGNIRYLLDLADIKLSSSARRGHKSINTPLRAPRLLEPDGHRYTIDDQFVQYFGWNFNFHMHSANGLQIVDLYFQGEKIAYEISLQDITAFYTGPASTWLGLYGASWLIGASSYELVPGVDCPATATFRDSYHFANSGSPLRYKNSICIFEQTASTPLRRHYSNGKEGKFDFYGGLMSSNLVVRTIVSVWNCDYIVDYMFHLDGTIQLKISLSGNVDLLFRSSAKENHNGNDNEDSVKAGLHQHLFHWKIDFDIEKTTNRFQTLDMTTETGSSFWYNDAVNNTQLRYDASLKESENEAMIQHDFDLPQHDIVYNMKSDNKYGANRGYRIINQAKSKFLLQHSTVARSAGWAKYQLAVTKYKDVEDSSSSIYAQGDPFDPVLDFTRYLEDNDSIVDTDLVVWVSSGFYHIPQSEDFPSSSTTLNQAQVFLRPYNFFNHCPSMAVSDALVIRHKNSENKDLLFDTFGTDSGEPHCYQKEKTVTEFDGEINNV